MQALDLRSQHSVSASSGCASFDSGSHVLWPPAQGGGTGSNVLKQLCLALGLEGVTLGSWEPGRVI